MELTVAGLGNLTGAEGRPLVIAGPCAAESAEQLRATAARLRGSRVDYFRAGIWKARTRPGGFEGLGEKALPWLVATGREFGLRTATEVATARHVEAAVEAGVDLLWIGARTTVNPFSVQEIAVALRGVELPVFVKNPTSPDVALWLGALERIHRAGVRQLAAIHRGFASASPTRYRNAPQWAVAIEFRRQAPHVPMIADPSHMAGRRDLILELSQEALAHGMDGLMVEVHPDPDHAWSDAAQQITPERLGECLARLVTTQGRSEIPAAQLEGLRDQIDHIDREVIALLGRRMAVVGEIGVLKREHHLPSLQLERWRALLADRTAQGEAVGLPAEYVRAVYEVIHAESVHRQAVLLQQAGGDPPGSDQ